MPTADYAYDAMRGGREGGGEEGKGGGGEGGRGGGGEGGGGEGGREGERGGHLYTINVVDDSFIIIIIIITSQVKITTVTECSY